MDFDKFKVDFGLMSEPWSDLDQTLIEMAVTRKGSFKEKFGLIDQKVLEWMGDVVLQIIVTSVIVDKLVSFENSKYFESLTKIRSQFVKNTTLYYQMQNKNLSHYLITKSDHVPIVKDIADILESILGALYYHLFYVKRDSTALLHISKWYRDFFSIDESIASVLQIINFHT